MNEPKVPWIAALRQALKRNRRDAHNRYLQLATVRPDGTPAVRTLVFRGLCEASMRLDMVTDGRSEKIVDIGSAARGEICWYFSHTREQFRLRGTLTLTGPEAAEQGLREALWQALSDAARVQFHWPAPGRPVGTGEANEPSRTDGPPDTFHALSLTIDHVDHLCLRGDPQRRSLAWRDHQGAWQAKAVNP